MRPFPGLIAVFFSALCFSAKLFAEQTEYRPYTIERTRVVDIHSEANGKDYELFIKLPKSYLKSDKKYPILVVNDANYAFPLVSSITRQLGDYGKKIEEVFLVGISYSKGDNGGVSRTRDYTPTYSPNERDGHSKESRLQSGKAEQYVEFIASELIPYLAENYRVDTDKKIFSGHSFGGLLGAYILVTKPATFDYYILGSPSLWYHDKVIFDLEKAYSEKNKTMPAKVLMITGEYENGGRYAMVDDMFSFEKIVKSRGYTGLGIDAKVLEEESHVSVFPSLITDGLLWAVPTGN